jgi:PAS domain S-box-containing protein
MVSEGAAESSASADDSHTVQFYEDEASLADTVSTFIGAGLAAGEPVLVIATAAHAAAFAARLQARSFDVERARKSGQLTLLDARALLGRLMQGGAPDPAGFRAVIGAIFDEARALGGRRVRAYGEMVDLLCREGNEEGALRLEELWNELGRARSFTLLCAYVMDDFFKESGAERFDRICALHTHARPSVHPARRALDEASHLPSRALGLNDEVERRKKLERELRRTQRRLDDLLENAVVPMHGVAPDGTILWANKAELELLGYTRDEYVGRRIAELHVDRATIDEILGQLNRKEPVRERPARLRKKDGSICHVLIDSSPLVEDGKVVHMRCFTRDVTARVQLATEEKQQKSDARMRNLVDSIRDYAIFVLDPTGRVSTWNPGAQRIQGWSADEIIGRHFSTFRLREDLDAGKCERELKVASETGRFQEEGWRVRKDGSRFWADVVLSAMRGERGQLVGFAQVTRDLTERRRLENERAALAAAEQADRAKDEFLAMLGHELRNPLAPIVTALSLIKLRGDASASRELVVIERQVQHVVRLVDDLLDVSRVTRGKIALNKEPLDLADVVVRAVEIASPLLERRRHELSVEVPRPGMRVVGDAVRLAQLVANLVTNAAKYTEVGGKIEVRAWRDGHEAVLQVKDNGVGIHPSLLPRIFDLFVQGPRTSDRAEGGLGIGLTVVRSVAQLHGGSVVALSDGPGRGSAFVVRLPTSTLEATREPPPAPLATAAAPRRVLVVDDNVDAASLLGELCTTMGHEVRVAHDGPQALAALDGFSPEVAILDIGLPVMDGYELAARIRERLDHGCRLIALTGYGQEHDRRRSEDSGFAAHLVKPVDPRRVLAIIDETAAPSRS